MNVENLEKLATYLESGGLKADFDMVSFAHVHTATPHYCGSVGCAVGHGPYAGIPKLAGELWAVYARRVFGLDDAQEEYCFDAGWVDYDNTPEGAAARIRHVIAGKTFGVPWHEDDDHY